LLDHLSDMEVLRHSSVGGATLGAGFLQAFDESETLLPLRTVTLGAVIGGIAGGIVGVAAGGARRLARRFAKA